MSPLQVVVLIVVSAVSSSLSTLWLVFARERDRLPYRWACPSPGCPFRVSGTHIDAVDFYASEHQQVTGHRVLGVDDRRPS